MKYIYPYLDHISFGVILATDGDPIDHIRTLVPSGVPFYAGNFNITEDLDDDFFDTWTSDFVDPDGYGVGMNYNDWIAYKEENNLDNLEINNKINEPKNIVLNINMDKARNIWKDKLRIDRKPLLEILDTKYIRALEKGDTKLIEKIVKKKDFLRDITSDPRIDIAKTTNDLKKITIPPNFIEE